MSDQMPQSFGGTPGKGEWKALQDFLKNPKDIAGDPAAAGVGRGQGVQELTGDHRGESGGFGDAGAPRR